MHMPVDSKLIGQAARYQDPEDALRAADGVYEDKALAQSEDERFALKARPRAPDPSPFKLGPVTGGG